MKYVLNQNPMNTANKQIRKMIRFIASSILCALILHMLAVRANALDVGLQWDTNNDAEYYVVYYGTDSGNYTAETEQIPAPQIQYAFSGLADTTWYFAVKAFNSCGNSSDFSDEVVYSPTSTPAPSPLTAAIESPSQDVSIIEGASVNFQGYVTGGTTPYAYNWYFDNSGASERSVEDPGSVTFTSAGTYDVTFTVDDNTGNSVSATVRVNVASAYVDVNPTASIASPSANVSITAGGSVNFQASVSSGNAPLTHAWNFGTGGPSARTVEDPGSVTFPTAGSYTVTYTVRDNDGDTSSDTVLVTVNAAYVDVNPTASITSPSANVSITAGGSVNFQASVSSGNAPLTHAWNFGTGGPSARTVEDPGSVTFPTAGSYTVTYTVRDNDGDTSSDTVLVTVNAAYVDVNPTASITSPSANVSITAGGSVNFQASVSSGNAPLTHAWNFGTGGPSARTVEDPGSVTFTKAGSYTVTYTVTDNDGDTSSDSVVVTVNAAYVDVNPTASITSPSANVSITAGGSVNFQASVSSGNAPLTHAWNFGTGGPSARTVEDPGSVTFPTAGSYTVTYTVRDNDGDTSSDSVVVTVNAAYVDVKPTASITSPSTNVSIIPGGTVNFQASVSSGNAPLTHAWNFGTGGPSAQTVEDPGSVTFPTAGSYTITYTVTDKDGDTSSDTVLVTVKAAYVDLTPSASITSPSSKVGITAGESVDFQASVSSGNAPLSYSWSFGTGAPSGQSVEDPGSVIFSDAGIYDVVFTVTDSDGDVSSATVSITVTTADTQVSGDDTVVSLTPVLVSNVDDAEPFTQWQISTDNEFNTVVMNVVTENSSIINVPLMVLTGKTKYYWRTKKNLSKSIDSTWSEPQSFVTDAITWNDNDGNRVRDDQEAPMGIDLNNDGIADYNQPDTITCVKSLIGSSSIGLVKMDNVVDIEVLESIDPDTIMDKVGRPANMPEGLLGFRIVVENPGDTVKIGVCLSEAAPEGAGWYKYDSISGWQDYTDHATFSPDRKMITVELTDGGEGDADGYANGVIVDPSGIGMEFATPVMAMGTPGADQGCFISIGSSNESTPPWQGLFAMVLFLASLSLRSGQKKSSDK